MVNRLYYKGYLVVVLRRIIEDAQTKLEKQSRLYAAVATSRSQLIQPFTIRQRRKDFDYGSRWFDW